VPAQVLDFNSFALHLRHGLQINSGRFSPDARLVEDLRLDSFDLTELLVVVEELGVRVPEDVAVGFETVGDVYRGYLKQAAEDAQAS
jgi:acyl carrier protein